MCSGRRNKTNDGSRASNLDGLTRQGKTVTVQTGVEDTTFEGEWLFQIKRPRGSDPPTSSSQSPSKDASLPAMRTKRTVEQQQLHEQGLWLKDSTSVGGNDDGKQASGCDRLLGQ